MSLEAQEPGQEFPNVEITAGDLFAEMIIQSNDETKIVKEILEIKKLIGGEGKVVFFARKNDGLPIGPPDLEVSIELNPNNESGLSISAKTVPVDQDVQVDEFIIDLILASGVESRVLENFNQNMFIDRINHSRTFKGSTIYGRALDQINGAMNEGAAGLNAPNRVLIFQKDVPISVTIDEVHQGDNFWIRHAIGFLMESYMVFWRE